MYTGEIVKTVNMMGKSLAQEVGSEPEALKQAQDSIENQLKAFDKRLWVQRDTTIIAGSKIKKKIAKVEKPKAAKSQNTAPASSVRRTR
jgi:hypothetical protein